MPRRFKLTAPDPSEDEFQKSVADLFHAILPPDKVAFSHFPSGGYQLTPAAKARLYRIGLTKGWPDLIVCYGGGKCLWLELKTRRGVVSSEQKQRHHQLRLLGHPVVLCRCIEDVIAALDEWRVPYRRMRLAGVYHGPSFKGTTPSGPTQSKAGAVSA